MTLKRRFPTSLYLRTQARRNLPRFAFEYADGGAGADGNIARNWSALDGVELMPRYGRVVEPAPTDATVFGHAYSLPFGIAPIGSPGTAYPGAETYMAKAAQKAGIPYVLGLLSGITIERAAELAPDVAWLQLYRFPRDEHKIGFDFVDRAASAGIHVLLLTMDTPIRTTRPREVGSGIMSPFRLSLRLRLDAMRAPFWMTSLVRNGMPKFASMSPYLGTNAGLVETARFVSRESGGAFTWEEVARYRDRWKKPLVLKGILHPGDAERAAELGVDGVLVSNHGGRQIEALPASIDALPAIRQVVGKRLTLFLDSGVRSGVDVARAVALGADAVFAGKAFLWSLGALGDKGPGHLIDLVQEELSATLGQLGCPDVAGLRSVSVHHPSAYLPQ